MANSVRIDIRGSTDLAGLATEIDAAGGELFEKDGAWRVCYFGDCLCNFTAQDGGLKILLDSPGAEALESITDAGCRLFAALKRTGKYGLVMTYQSAVLAEAQSGIQGQGPTSAGEPASEAEIVVEGAHEGGG